MAVVQALVDRILDVFEPRDGGYIDETDPDFTEEDGIDEAPDEIVPAKRKPLATVRPINTRGYEVMVISPKSFDESLEISKNLIDRKTVVMNLELLSHEESQRVVDFLSGTAVAINGNQQKIGDGVFIFTPNNVNITAEQEKKTTASIADAFWNQVK